VSSTSLKRRFQVFPPRTKVKPTFGMLRFGLLVPCMLVIVGMLLLGSSEAAFQAGPTSSPHVSVPSKSPAVSAPSASPSRAPSRSPSMAPASKAPSKSPTISKPTASPSASPTATNCSVAYGALHTFASCWNENTKAPSVSTSFTQTTACQRILASLNSLLTCSNLKGCTAATCTALCLSRLLIFVSQV